MGAAIIIVEVEADWSNHCVSIDKTDHHSSTIGAADSTISSAVSSTVCWVWGLWRVLSPPVIGEISINIKLVVGIHAEINDSWWGCMGIHDGVSQGASKLRESHALRAEESQKRETE